MRMCKRKKKKGDLRGEKRGKDVERKKIEGESR